MTNHNDTGHLPTTFPVDANLTEFPIDSSQRFLKKIIGLAHIGDEICGLNSKGAVDGLWLIGSWEETAELFNSIMDDAEMLGNLLSHYHRTRGKSEGMTNGKEQ